MAGYSVQDSAGYIKLDAMENPYSMPDDLLDAWLARLRDCSLNRYPDPSASALREIIRDRNGVPEAAGILFGNGSDELIQILLMAVAAPDITVLSPEPGFVMYRQIAKALGLHFIGVPLKAQGFGLDMKAMRVAIRKHQPAVIFLAYPNNPTGNLFDRDEMDEMISSAPGLVVVDEAYAPFVKSSFMDVLPDFEHLLVMRTMSKLGLAGLRLGFVAGARSWTTQFDKIRLPYNINSLTQISAEFALSHFSVFESQTEQICQDRQLLFDSLAGLKGVTPFPSRANFILFRVDKGNADAVFESLKGAGILIKNVSSGAGLLENCLRVTVGKGTENEAFISALEEILSG